MPSAKRKFGDIGEREAENFLIKRGYRILDKNYRIKNLGEIDLIGEKGGRLIFFEVKTRNSKYEEGFPTQTSINSKKRRNLKRVCQLYLDDKKYSPDKEWQVDAVFVKVDFQNDFHTVEHLENILWERYY
jgi:putative endonuclease